MTSNPQIFTKRSKQDENNHKLVNQNLQKHNSDEETYNTIIANDLIYDKKRHIGSLFKDYLFWDDCVEFMTRSIKINFRFYNRNDSVTGIKQVIFYFEENLWIRLCYYTLECYKIISSNRRRKMRLLETYLQYGLGNRVNKEFSNILDNTGLVENIISRQLDVTEYEIIKIIEKQENTLLKTSVLDISLFSQFKALTKAINNEPENKDIPAVKTTCNKSPEKKTKTNKLNLEELVIHIRNRYSKMLHCRASIDTDIYTPLNVKRKSSHGIVDLKLLDPGLHCQTEPDKNEYKNKYDVSAKRYLLSKPKILSQGSTNCSGLHSGSNQNNSLDKKYIDTRPEEAKKNSGLYNDNHFYKVATSDRGERPDKVLNHYNIKMSSHIKSLYYQKSQQQEGRSRSTSKDKLNVYLTKKKIDIVTLKERSNSAKKRHIVYDASFRPVSISPEREARKPNPLCSYKNVPQTGKESKSRISKNNSNVNSANVGTRNTVIKKPCKEIKPSAINLKKFYEPTGQYKTEGVKKNKVFK
jgi:hypothetical protein